MEIDYKDRGWKGRSRRGARGPTFEDRSGVASMWGVRREVVLTRFVVRVDVVGARVVRRGPASAESRAARAPCG